MKNLGNPLGNYKWFIGQVPPNQNQYSKNSTWNDAHGDRVKVRIPSIHPVSGKDATLLKDDDLPWAIVAHSTSHGNRNLSSSGIWGGEWVIGFFMDEECQIPVITHVMGNNLTEYELKESSNGTTQGKRVSRYNSGLTAGPHQTKGVTSFTTGPAQPTKQEFEKAKKSIADPQTGVANESGQGIGDITGDWKGGRDEITETDYEKIITSNDPRVTDGVKSDAARAALNSGIIDQNQWLKVTEGL